MCVQQSLRSACAYAQSDQSLWQSLEYSMSVKLLSKHHLELLSLTGGCTGLFESTLVKLPHCWQSHVIHLIIIRELHGVPLNPMSWLLNGNQLHIVVLLPFVLCFSVLFRISNLDFQQQFYMLKFTKSS